MLWDFTLRLPLRRLLLRPIPVRVVLLTLAAKTVRASVIQAIHLKFTKGISIARLILRPIPVRVVLLTLAAKTVRASVIQVIHLKFTKGISIARLVIHARTRTALRTLTVQTDQTDLVRVMYSSIVSRK